MKDKIQNWYKWGFWTIDMVSDAVANGVIDAKQFKEITGEDFQ